jgi:hypothetical protein
MSKENVAITILGHTLNITVEASKDGLHIVADAKETKGLESYLIRALIHADKRFQKENLGDLSQMIRKGTEFEASTKTKLTEPLTKLPYDVPVATKEQVAELADMETQETGVKTPQTQVLIKIIEAKYAELFPEG